MPVLGITGGIATGKSSFVRALAACFSKQAASAVSGASRVSDMSRNSGVIIESPITSSEPVVFDADAAAHELLAGDSTVRQQIVATFGQNVLSPDGWPDRLRLREVVFGNPEARKGLENILHPIIRERWIALTREYRNRPDWLLVDIPLLYETEAQHELPRVAVVACSAATQLARLREHRRLAEETIASILAAQLDLGVKVAAAQHVVWNDSSPACLQRQASLLADSLRYLYG